MLSPLFQVLGNKIWVIPFILSEVKIRFKKPNTLFEIKEKVFPDPTC